MTILEIQNLTKVYNNTNNSDAIINNLSLSVDSNEFLCILGPSGCGKSTLLRCIAGFEKYSGKILVNDIETSVPSPDRIMVFQDYNQLFPWKTVEKNIQFPLKVCGIKDKKQLQKLSNNALKMVHLSSYAKYYPHQLSGGMKQRVAIAKALVQKPEIILMDEPFAALDAISRRNLQSELSDISQKETCTFIFVTHNIQEAITLGKRIIVMNKSGEIITDIRNNLKRPITPSTEGYGIMWEILKNSLNENTN